MTRDAVDFSDARPSADELAANDVDAIGYVGRSRPDQGYLDSLAAAGIRWSFTFETDPNRSGEGYQAGVYDAEFFEARARERGYPDDAPALVVVSDGTSSIPSWGGEARMDYGEAWARTIARQLAGYGNRYCVDAFNAGVARVDRSRLLLPDGGWLPIPWGGNRDRDVMGQDANTPSPIAGTDLNRVWVDFHHAPAPASPIESVTEDEPMLLIPKSDGIFVKGGHLYLVDSYAVIDLHPEPLSSFRNVGGGIVEAATLDAIVAQKIQLGIAVGTIPKPTG